MNKRRFIVILVVMVFCLGLMNTPTMAGPTGTNAAVKVDQSIQSAWELEYVGRISGPITAIDVQGSYAYVTDTNIQSLSASVRVVDITDPTSPVEIDSYFFADALGVDVSGHYVYVANAYNGMYVLHFTVPQTVWTFLPNVSK